MTRVSCPLAEGRRCGEIANTTAQSGGAKHEKTKVDASQALKKAPSEGPEGDGCGAAEEEAPEPATPRSAVAGKGPFRKAAARGPREGEEREGGRERSAAASRERVRRGQELQNNSPKGLDTYLYRADVF